MRIISWNVNGLRAMMGKADFAALFAETCPDIFCVQETKMQQGQAAVDLPDYAEYWNSAEKKGYSGTAVFSKYPARAVFYDDLVNDDTGNMKEGRIITLEFDGFFLVNVYAPNSQTGLARLGYRSAWQEYLTAHLKKIDAIKPVILCGDLNVAHKEIDLKHPKQNEGSAGFSPQERGMMTAMLEAGFADSFRRLYPDRTDAYTWWNMKFNARATNAGWRIDYFLVSERIADRIIDAGIMDQYYGSDHCPVELKISL